MHDTTAVLGKSVKLCRTRERETGDERERGDEREADDRERLVMRDRGGEITLD